MTTLPAICRHLQKCVVSFKVRREVSLSSDRVFPESHDVKTCRFRKKIGVELTGLSIQVVLTQINIPPAVAITIRG